MLDIIIVLVGFCVIGLLVEKLVHTNYNITQLTLILKQDVIKFVKALFCEPRVRHRFDITLVNDFKMILKPYVKMGFEIQFVNQIFKGVPVIGIRFVPDHQLEKEELHELLNLLCIKMREYIGFYGLSWKIFSTYSIGTDYVNVYIHYAEWREDLQPFTNAYRHWVRKSLGKSGGILRDEELDEELKNVD